MSHNADSDLPLVVQLGFSGSRSFVPPERQGTVDEVAFNNEITQFLVERLKALPADLGLPQQRFFCGVCQLAIGGDTLFVQACRQQKIPLRIFLPEPPDVFFDMGHEVADFTPEQKRQGKELLESPDVIQCLTVGKALTREARFEQVNHEIARVSHLLICVVRKGAERKPGGAIAVIERASVRQRPVLKITVDEENGHPKFDTEWIDRENFVVPQPPKALMHTGPSRGEPLPLMPPIDVFVSRLREESRVSADRFRNWFTIFATTIIGTHVGATLLALLALVFPHLWPVVPVILTLELLSLLTGFGVHWWMHKSHVVRNWANQRLVEQIAASVDAMRDNHVPLEHLFDLPLPEDFRSVMRTLNVLHLSSTRPAASPWEERRKKYVNDRVNDQAKYYKGASARAKRRLKFCHRAFMFCSALAIVATVIKLGLWWEHAQHADHAMATASRNYNEDQSSGQESGKEHDSGKKTGAGSGNSTGASQAKEETKDPITTTLGAFAVFLPVLAVGAMSIAAAHDLEGRIHTYEDMETFLDQQREFFGAAASEEDFVRLLMETESRLLGETANWFSRRSFTGVA